MTNSIYLRKLYVILINLSQKKLYKLNITFSSKIKPKNLHSY